MYMVNHPLREWISIHKALASLDFPLNVDNIRIKNFNPQGSREPRPPICSQDTPACRNFNPQGSREPRHICCFANSPLLGISIHKALASLDYHRRGRGRNHEYFNPQGSREPRQQNYPNLLHIPPNILYIMLFSPQFNQFSPFTQPAFTAFSSVFQVRISLAFHVSLAFAPGLKGSQLTETNSTYILHNPSFPAYILHAAKPLPPPPDTLSIQASFVPDIWLPA